MKYKNKAITLAPPPQQIDDQNKAHQLFFHVVYHIENIKYFEYQRKFKEKILKPKYRRSLSKIKNKSGFETKFDKIVVAYSRPQNLGNILSYRKLKAHIRPPTYPTVIASRDLIYRELDVLDLYFLCIKLTVRYI